MKDHDLQILTSNYTAKALATGLRDREETLQVSGRGIGSPSSCCCCCCYCFSCSSSLYCSHYRDCCPELDRGVLWLWRGADQEMTWISPPPGPQICARLLADGNIDQLRAVLHPYEEDHIMRGRKKKWALDLSNGLQQRHLNMLRKYLHRMPRQITRSVDARGRGVASSAASFLSERLIGCRSAGSHRVDG